MRSACWVGMAVIAVAIVGCGEDVKLEDGSGGGGGAAASTSSVAGPSGPSTSSSGTPATTGGEGGAPDQGSAVVVGQGGGGASEGGGTGEGGSIDPYVPPDGAYEACEGYWAPMADLLVECLGSTGEYFYGGDETVDRLAENCAHLIFRGDLTVDEQNLCNADIAAIDSCEALDAYLNSGSDACTATLYGSAEDGAPCLTGYECASAACYVAPDETCGTCRPTAGEGEECEEPLTFCGPYLSCVEGSCEYRRGLGEECDDEISCESGLACVGGECDEPIAEGDPCNVQSPTYECTDGTYCNFETEVCDVMPTETLGGDCGVLDDGRLGLCEGGLRCLVDAQYRGECVKATADGGACSQNTPILLTNECASPAGCFDGECALRADALSCF